MDQEFDELVEQIEAELDRAEPAGMPDAIELQCLEGVVAWFVA